MYFCVYLRVDRQVLGQRYLNEEVLKIEKTEQKCVKKQSFYNTVKKYPLS